MTALQNGEGEIAFVQTDIAYYATEGLIMFEGQKIDSISALGALISRNCSISNSCRFRYYFI